MPHPTKEMLPFPAPGLGGEAPKPVKPPKPPESIEDLKSIVGKLNTMYKGKEQIVDWKHPPSKKKKKEIYGTRAVQLAVLIDEDLEKIYNKKGTVSPQDVRAVVKRLTRVMLPLSEKETKEVQEHVIKTFRHKYVAGPYEGM